MQAGADCGGVSGKEYGELIKRPCGFATGSFSACQRTPAFALPSPVALHLHRTTCDALGLHFLFHHTTSIVKQQVSRILISVHCIFHWKSSYRLFPAKHCLRQIRWRRCFLRERSDRSYAVGIVHREAVLPAIGLEVLPVKNQQLLQPLFVPDGLSGQNRLGG